MSFWHKISRFITALPFGLSRYKRIRILRQGKEDLVFSGRRLGGDCIQVADSKLDLQLYAKQSGEIILEIKQQDKDGTDHAALEFPNTEEAIKFMTKVSEDTEKDGNFIKAMMN